MPGSSPSEERFPLLLLFLEDGQRSKHKKIHIDKTRYQGITSGATAVITQWPGHLTTCWLTAMVIGIAIIVMSMMMFALSVRPGNYMLSAMCKNHNLYDKENQSPIIHLVHGPSPWLQSQLNTLEQVAQNYRQSNVELMMIQNEAEFNQNTQDDKQKFIIQNVKLAARTKENKDVMNGTSKQNVSTKINWRKSAIAVKRLSTTQPSKKRYYPWETIELNINIGTRNLLKNLLKRSRLINTNRYSKKYGGPSKSLKKRQSFQNLLQTYPNLHIKNTTYEDFFKHTPLHFTWQKMNQITRLFAVRVIQTWNFAGITFDLPELSQFDTQAKTALKSQKTSGQNEKAAFENVGRYRKLITVGLLSFENLPEGLVTVDNEGLHMETKTICHAFFGQILTDLKRATIETMPKDVIKKALLAFCKRGAVDPEYCRKNT